MIPRNNPLPHRRGFLTSSLSAFGATFAIGGTRRRVLGANDRLRIAIAGLNGRGQDQLKAFTALPDVEIAYLIDPDSRTFTRPLNFLSDRNQPAPRPLADVRVALDDPSIDVLSIATPNHWHALMTIWACQAGKDVYVEKPCSHDVHEGRMAVEAARKHNRVVQHGTQGRSEKRWAQVAAIARDGSLGKLLAARGLCFKRRESIGVKPDGTIPAELDYNLWLGPAPNVAYNPNYVHYNWHWFWPFGNGDIGNQGVHQMDIARWIIPDATLPTSVVSLGGRFGYQDQAETPNTLVTAFQFGSTPLLFEVRGLPSKPDHGVGTGNIFHFEEGTITNSAFFPRNSDKPANLPGLDPLGVRDESHFANFLAAVRDRTPDTLAASILEGHRSSALCHLANISYQLGRPVASGGQTPTQIAPLYREAIEQMYTHLAEVGATILNTNGRVGPRLDFDPETERFHGDHADKANALLSRESRAPFAPPASIAAL